MVVSYTVGNPTERRFQKVNKKMTCTTHFLYCPKTGAGPYNDETWMFIKYSRVISRWKAHEKEISITQKKLDPTHPLPPPPKNRPQAQNEAKMGAHKVWSWRMPLES